jgi:hypothetical protein
MLNRIFIGLGVFVLISIIGIIDQVVVLSKRKKETDFIIQYLESLKKIYNGDSTQYGFIMENYNKAQRLLGVNGIIAKLRLPFEKGYHINVPVLNLLSDMLDKSYYNEDSSRESYNMICQAFLRTLGDYNEAQNKLINGIKNIFVDFFKGFNLIIASPFLLISYMFFNKNIFKSTKAKPYVTVFILISRLIQLIGVISGIITIILGWSDFIDLFT